MTMRDPEVLDVLRNEPELLALADALADTQRLRSSRLRRLSPRVAGVAAVAAGIAAVVLLWPGGSGNNSILGRAAAALGDDAVLHLVGEFYLAGKISSASETYGALGAAAAIIAWLYLFGRLLVASAMLNATLWERHQSPVSVAPAALRRRLSGPLLTLQGEKSEGALVRGAATSEDGHIETQSGRR